MKSKPFIEMTANEVRAILLGEKSLMRFPVHPQPDCGWSIPPARFWEGKLNRFGCMEGEDSISPPFSVGNVILVKEHYWRAFKRTPTSSGAVFLADYGAKPGMIDVASAESNWSWRSPSSMPLYACRMKIRITRISVCRVHSLTDPDFADEGIVEIGRSLRSHGKMNGYGFAGSNPASASISRTSAYMKHWAKKFWWRDWNRNPFAWEMKFKVVELDA